MRAVSWPLFHEPLLVIEGLDVLSLSHGRVQYLNGTRKVNPKIWNGMNVKLPFIEKTLVRTEFASIRFVNGSTTFPLLSF